MAKTSPKKTTQSKATKTSGGTPTKKPAKPAKVVASKNAKPAKTTTKSKAPAPVARKAEKPAPKPALKAAPKPAPKLVAKAPAKANNRNSVGSQPVGSQTSRILPPASPASSTPSGKNPSGLNKRDLEFFRDLLIAKKRELLGDVHSMEQEALRAGGNSNLSNLPIHMADMGTDNYEQEFTLGLVEKDRQLLREINVALAKIADGRYGICEGTGKPITRARLEAQPWARFSIEHARQLEKGFGMYRGVI